MPGGWGTRALLDGRARCSDWIRASARDHALDDLGLHRLAAARRRPGVLDGLEATTHWLELETLAEFGARPIDRRVVEQGK